MAEALKFIDQPETSVTAADDLPEQMGAPTPTVMPGPHLLQLPINLDQCWAPIDIEMKDKEGNIILDANGAPKVDHHLQLKFDNDNPLIVVEEGPFKGLPIRVTVSTIGRNRAKKTEEPRIVADITFLLRESLNDRATVIATRKDWIAAVNKHAGRVIRIESGLSANCDAKAVRYVDEVELDGQGQPALNSEGQQIPTGNSIKDPSGTTGCGKRFYTQAFKVKNQETGVTEYTDQRYCDCGARLRGFFRIERWLKPLASTTTVQR